MVRSRQLFLRSRLELAAELDYTALEKLHKRHLCSVRKTYFLALGLQFFCVLPLVVVYGMAYYFTCLTSNNAAADRLMPYKFLLTISLVTPEDGDEDDNGGEWEGRVLDVEKRTKAIIKKVQGELEEVFMAQMKQMEAKMDEKLADILSLLNAPQPGVSTTDAQSAAVDEADVDLDIVSNVSRRAPLALSSAMS